jgi:hypothetical protein
VLEVCGRRPRLRPSVVTLKFAMRIVYDSIPTYKRSSDLAFGVYLDWNSVIGSV